MTERAKLKVGMVSPYAWSSQWGVNRHIAGLAAQLSRQGHDVAIIVPAEQRNGGRAARRQARSAKRSGQAANPVGAGPAPGYLDLALSGAPLPIRVLKIRGTFRFPYSEHLANLALPLDVTEQLNGMLGRESFDILHVHEPYPPSLSFSALRLAQSPVVATFHTGGERFLSYQLMRPVVERFFGRLDGRICSSQNTRRIVSSYFPGDYSVIGSGVDYPRFNPDTEGKDREIPPVVFAAWGDPRKGLALLTRVMRLLPDDVSPFELAIAGGDEFFWRKNLIIPRRLRSLLSFSGPSGPQGLASTYARAEVLLAPFATSGQATAVLEAMACACAVVVPGQGGLKELVAEGSEGFLLDHPYAYNLAALLVDLLLNERTRKTMGSAAARKARKYSWEKLGPRIARTYDVAHRRRRRAAPAHGGIEAVEVETILADLHMHTSFSSDCKTTPEELLAACEESGLKAIAITDHNAIAGALEVARLAPEDMHVIIGEEIKTAAGEIIGLYLAEEIPKGLSLEETIARIREQGGLVYVPHPFDPLHKTPSYETLARNAANIDIVEVYNPRITFSSFNERAQRLARKYDIPGAAGSDCHVKEGVGTAMISLRRFSGPQELLLSLREADIIRSSVSPLYLHSLKFLKSGRSTHI